MIVSTLLLLFIYKKMKKQIMNITINNKQRTQSNSYAFNTRFTNDCI